MADKFEELKKEYIAQIPGKMKQLQDDFSKLKQNPSIEALKPVRMVIHKTAGTAGSFGYSQVTDICRAMDSKLTSIIDENAQDKINAQLISEIESCIKNVNDQFNK